MTTTAQPTLTLLELGDTHMDHVESYSPFCLKVHRALRSRGLAYARRHDRPDAHRESPWKQVPVLLIGGTDAAAPEVVWDSTRILRRIGELSGRPFDDAYDTRTRAEIALTEELADTACNGFLVASRWADPRNWERTQAAYFAGMPEVLRWLIVPRIRGRIVKALSTRDVLRQGQDECWRRFDVLLESLEARAPREGFWFGSTISSADLALFGQLQSFRTPLTLPQREAVERHAALTAYLDRMDAATRKDEPRRASRRADHAEA